MVNGEAASWPAASGSLPDCARTCRVAETITESARFKGFCRGSQTLRLAHAAPTTCPGWGPDKKKRADEARFLFAPAGV